MELSERFDEALTLAHRLHAQQMRKGTDIPYVSHLLAVASLVLEYGGTEEEAIGGLLHDAVEDAGGAEIAILIKEKFGENVANMVIECSDTDISPKPPWTERKIAYIKHMDEASASARLISAADKLHNVRAIISDLREHGDEVWDRFSGGKDGTLWYYRSLVEKFQKYGPRRLALELDHAVTLLERESRA